MLFRVLAEHVGRYLDAVDRMAAAQQLPVGSELRRMSAAWRTLLGLHWPAGTRGRCTGCGRWHGRHGGSARGAARQGMCTVWRVANAYFISGR